jgi:hypothetical protein
MRNPRTTAPTSPTTSSYVSSVPMTIFREMSTDLQSTKNELTQTQRQNQQLLQQNQYLRLEMQRLAEQSQEVVNTFLDVENPVELLNRSLAVEAIEPDYQDQWNSFEPPLPQVPARVKPTRKVVPHAQQRHTQIHIPLGNPQNPVLNFIEETKERWNFHSQTTTATELSGWKMTLLMSLIILSAFGAGFLIVRPLMNNANQQR